MHGADHVHDESCGHGKTHTVYAKHEHDRVTKGTLSGLKRGRNKLNQMDSHTLYGHLGYCKGCIICQMIW